MFSVILDPFQGSFFREIRISTTSHSEYKISKRKNECYQKAKISFLGLQVLLTGLWNLKNI